MPKPLRPLTPDASPAHQLGAELRDLRCKNGHSQRSLGAVVHVSPSMIGAIETGERISTAAVLKACDDELGAAGELRRLWNEAAQFRREARRPVKNSDSETARRAGRAAGGSSLERAIGHVERAWAVRLHQATMVRGPGSIGSSTDRGTWLRLERARVEEISLCGWGGAEAAAAIDGVSAPSWIRTFTWRGDEQSMVWRAEETELVREPTIARGPALEDVPKLSPAWWTAWGASMDALADARSARIAVSDGQPVTAEHVARTIETMWPGRTDPLVREWTSGHGQMTWRKVTSPTCWIVGWDGFGLAPRGLDAATLWSNSLAAPEIAARIWQERRADLESPTGRVMALFCLANLVRSPHTINGCLLGLALRQASFLLDREAHAA